MAKLMVTIEHDIEEKEVLLFKKLSEQLNISVQQAIEKCMFEKRDEYLDMLENNVPSKEE